MSTSAELGLMAESAPLFFLTAGGGGGGGGSADWLWRFWGSEPIPDSSSSPSSRSAGAAGDSSSWRSSDAVTARKWLELSSEVWTSGGIRRRTSDEWERGRLKIAAFLSAFYVTKMSYLGDLTVSSSSLLPKEAMTSSSS